MTCLGTLDISCFLAPASFGSVIEFKYQMILVGCHQWNSVCVLAEENIVWGLMRNQWAPNGVHGFLQLQVVACGCGLSPQLFV